MGPMINMKDLMNVRESYSKKMAEEEAENGLGNDNDRRMGFMMMMAMGGNGVTNANMPTITNE